MSDDQMAEAMRRQREHVNASLSVDQRGWTQAQWVEDARRLMGDVDGSVRDLVNGHVSALLAEVEWLRSVLGPNYHVADIREDGWSIQHPIRCREAMLDCDLHRVATHDWQEPPAPVGRYRATLTASMGIALARLDGDAS